MSREWEDSFYDAVSEYIDEEESRFKLESLWQRYEFDLLEDPRAAEISAKVRSLMNNDYRSADSNIERKRVLVDVKDQLEQYYQELEYRDK